MFAKHTSKGISLPKATLIAIGMGLLSQQAAAAYRQDNLVSNIPGLAAHTDPNLVNPWGISYAPTGPFWVSDNGNGLSTLYNTGGTPQGLVVTVPTAAVPTPPPLHSAPTGQVFNINNGTGGTPVNFLSDRFIFATEGGTIAGWQGGTSAVTRIDESASGAVYKGLAIDNGTGQIYAANFAAGTVEVFGSNYAPVTSFTDPSPPPLPAGAPAGSTYAPFNVQNIGGELFVAFAVKGAGQTDETAGAGYGFIDRFAANGTLLGRFTEGGPLNAPWGFALAPANFGEFSNDLLVGNFGDGRINAFDPTNGNFLGALTGASGSPISIDGLWGLAFGNGGNGGATDKLYFAAGINGEADGLFGSLSVVPEPGSLSLIGLGLSALELAKRRRGERKKSLA